MTVSTLTIAIVCDYFLDFVGGAQTSMREQQRALVAAGHRVIMISAARGRGRRVRTVADGIEITPILTMPGLELPVIANSSRTREVLRATFAEHGVDVVHVQTEFGLAHAAADVAAERRIPVVHTVHTFYWASEDDWFNPLAGLLRSLLHRLTGATIPRLQLTPRPVDNLLRNLTLAMTMRADTVVSPSSHQARDLEAAGAPTPVALLANPIATSPRGAVPVPRSGATPRFLWVARCEPVKRPLPFARAAIAALARTGGGFTVDFIGDGTEHAALQKLLAPHPQLRAEGSLPHDEVLGLMDESSIVVLTSVGFDNQPMTIAEAVSRERGILYCDPKLREGLLHAGYLAESPDVSGLTDAIVALVNTPELVLDLSRGAARDGEQFTPKAYVERSTEIFHAARAKLDAR